VSQVLTSREPGPAVKAVFGLVLFASLTDVLDGWLSRRLQQTSEFGRIYDPVVDIVFHATMAVVLYAGGAVTPAYLEVVLLRYLLPPVAGALLFLLREPFRVKSTAMGKASSLVLSVFLCAVVFSRAYELVRPGWVQDVTRDWLEPLAILVCAATVLAFAVRGVKILRGAERRGR
jgi:phosphatidylglycerophosphate synthase